MLYVKEKLGQISCNHVLSELGFPIQQGPFLFPLSSHSHALPVSLQSLHGCHLSVDFGALVPAFCFF